MYVLISTSKVLGTVEVAQIIDQEGVPEEFIAMFRFTSEGKSTYWSRRAQILKIIHEDDLQEEYGVELTMKLKEGDVVLSKAWPTDTRRRYEVIGSGEAGWITVKYLEGERKGQQAEILRSTVEYIIRNGERVK